MSGDSFMKGVFGGVVAESLVYPYPEPSRGEADQVLATLEGLRRFAAKHVDSARIDESERIDPEILRGLAELGVLGLVAPKDRGGGGLSMSGYARVIQELAGLDPSVALTVSAHESLALTAIQLFATEEVKAAWIPKLARGEAFAAFALAETGAGSDAASIQTRADKDGDAYVLKGEKAWVTNGSFADVFVVFARTSAADEGAKPRLTAFVVPRGPGVAHGADDPTSGVRGASTTIVTFDRVRVPESHVLGDVGRGFKVAMEVLTHARLSLASGCVGQAKRLLKLVVDRVAERKAFGRTLAEFGLMRDKIAEMTAAIFAMESAVYLTTGIASSASAAAGPSDQDFSVESAICKVFASETLWQVANESQQIAAGLGTLRRAPWERLFRDARIPMVFEGTNEILRCFIALSGMQAPSREIDDSSSVTRELSLTKAMREPIKGFGLLGDFVLGKARSALGRERMTKAHPLLAREAVTFEEYTGELAKSVGQVLRRHGKNIAEMQYSQKRAADVAIDLYAIAAVLSRTTRAIERRGEEGARREIDLTMVFVSQAKTRLAENIAAFDENDDELRKAVAQKTCADGGYPLDVL